MQVGISKNKCWFPSIPLPAEHMGESFPQPRLEEELSFDSAIPEPCSLFGCWMKSDLCPETKPWGPCRSLCAGGWAGAQRAQGAAEG